MLSSLALPRLVYRPNSADARSQSEFLLQPLFGSQAPALQRNCCRFLGFYSPAAFFCSGSAGRCGASFKRHQKISKEEARRWWRMRQEATEQSAKPRFRSWSLDNVLAIAGAARDHPLILAFGLLLSIGLMGVAANFIGRLVQNHRWIAYVGLAIILYVACEMIYRGAYELKTMIN
jgi:hypothetical protein